MNLRVIGLGGILGAVVFLFSQLLLISWVGEAVFNEPNISVLVSEIFLVLILMAFTSFLLVEELKNGKKLSRRRE